MLSNLQKLAKGAAKKKVLRPQPKLDAERSVSSFALEVIAVIGFVSFKASTCHFLAKCLQGVSALCDKL